MMVMLSSPPPSEEALAAERQLPPPHGHRSDCFRFTLRGEWIVGQSTYPRGRSDSSPPTSTTAVTASFRALMVLGAS
jgi:hypothetical protein